MHRKQDALGYNLPFKGNMMTKAGINKNITIGDRTTA